MDGKRAVLVRGFDFGTTDEQMLGHMSGAGTIEDLYTVDQGSTCVTYSSVEEAKAAVQKLNQTIISGNSRYIDVIPLDTEEFLAGHDIDMDKSMQFLALAPEQQQAVMAKGSLSTARDPTAVLATRMKQVKGIGGKGSAKGSNSFGGMGSSFDGKFAVLVRGFDFGTTEEQIASHMSGAGAIENLQMFDQGSACVTYSSAGAAKAAVQAFNQTIISGNSRYLDVFGLDPDEFLAGYNIDEDKIVTFKSLNPQQQQAVMAKGSLATARDPSAVLLVRMNQAKGGGKGSFGAAGGIKGSTGNGPYGGKGGKGGMGQGCMGKAGKSGKMAMMMQMMEEAFHQGFQSAEKWGGKDGGSWGGGYQGDTWGGGSW